MPSTLRFVPIFQVSRARPDSRFATSSSLDGTDRFQFHKLAMEATIGTDATTATGDRLAVRPPHDVSGVHWVHGNDGSWTAFTTPSFVSSSSLKRMLDSRYAGRYSVELKRDTFKISIQN